MDKPNLDISPKAIILQQLTVPAVDTIDFSLTI